MKLYTFWRSQAAFRVRIALNLKGLTREDIVINLDRGDQFKPEYRAQNPQAVVPTLYDGNAKLFQSVAILEYLEEKYPNPPLLPKEPGQKAKARILIDYGMSHFDGPYQKLRMELMKEQKDQNPQVIDDAKSELRKLLQRLENEIGAQQYLMGDFSLVDADLLPRFTRLEGFGVLPDPSLPRLGKYLERMKARPSVKAIL